VSGVLLALALALAPSTGAVASGAEPRITGLRVRPEAAHLLVSFEVEGALDAETMERVHSGLPLAYRHTVEVVGRRAIPLWPAKVLARARIDVRVQYDSLTRQYHLTRDLELRRRKAAPPAESETHGTESIEAMRSWMTRVEDLPLLDLPFDAGDERLRLRVETSLGRRYVLYLFPGRVTVSAEQELEF
jgi:hypothetical protein